MKIPKAAVIALALVLASVARAEEAPRFTAVIADIRGPVTILQESAGESSRASIGRRLQVGDTLETGTGSSATIFLSGGQLLELLENSRIRITKDLHAESGSAKRLASMSRSSLRVLERGIWVMSDPGGSTLVAGLRGPAAPLAKPGSSGVIPLSPRHEVVLDTRPAFYWSGTDAPVRVVVARENRIVWRSHPAEGLTRPGSEDDALEPGGYTWWIETEGTSRPLSPKVPFEVAEESIIADATAFESTVADLEKSRGDGALSGFLKCAYYLEARAWSAVLVDSIGTTDPGSAEPGYEDRCTSAARSGMGLGLTHESLFRGLVSRGRTGGSSS